MLTNSVENLNENKSSKEEVAALKKKVEYLIIQINHLKEKEEENRENTNKNIDVNKLLEVSAFNDYRSSISNYHTILEKRCEELERMIDDSNGIMESKPNIKDVKMMEESLKNRIDDLKNTSSKRFCEKPEAYKQFKFLEIRIKSIEDKDKNKGKGDNWLIAKKPVNGYSCASCESYIGEIKDNVQPIHWNKFQNRDITSEQNKTYRVIIE